ncbi:DUF427 domain-containing protein [Mycolicibacter longobardus]|uniref:DUF427 domain-containing protein n=1 Tax=Mycolicibacter longobardus TaxID=1108812 RepID=A0A1X1YE37_9MYCO|nr:DUF427 domain-containing protein [Mycolicibacter longobardus]MCV7382989.1 DUF427 domain-containing protein [Mycolicibacter longobardus]ORW09388.1 hypothetical protein AWC16_16320 [Mycolicibacter longobardus]
MSLVAGHGPLSTERAGWFSPEITADLVYVEPHPRRVRAVRGDHTVIDTEHVLLVHRRGAPLSYAFPADAVGDLPHRALPEATGYVQVPWEAVDAWFEEGRRLVHYPPNPYHRVDCRPTRRALRVEVAGVCLADTDDTVILFETALQPRLYVAPERVRTDLLQASTTSTYCNYKGYASYWSAVVGDTVVPDVAWCYPDPLPESTPIAGFFSFDMSRVDGFAELPAPVGRPSP